MTDTTQDLTVYIVEDDNGVSKSLTALMKSHGYESIACASAEDFLNRYDPALKACMILDLRLPGMNGLQLLTHLDDIRVTLPVVVLTAHGDVPIAVQAMRAGAIDFIEKPARTEQLLDAIRMADDLAFDRMPQEIPKKIVTERLSRLTEREREVLNHLLDGKLNKEIASLLGVSRRTVEVHRARIREKMQARGIADLIRMLG